MITQCHKSSEYSCRGCRNEKAPIQIQTPLRCSFRGSSEREGARLSPIPTPESDSARQPGRPGARRTTERPKHTIVSSGLEPTRTESESANTQWSPSPHREGRAFTALEAQPRLARGPGCRRQWIDGAGLTVRPLFGMLRLDPETVLILLSATRIPGRFYRTGTEVGPGALSMACAHVWSRPRSCAVTSTVTTNPFFPVLDIIGI